MVQAWYYHTKEALERAQQKMTLQLPVSVAADPTPAAADDDNDENTQEDSNDVGSKSKKRNKSDNKLRVAIARSLSVEEKQDLLREIVDAVTPTTGDSDGSKRLLWLHSP